MTERAHSDRLESSGVNVRAVTIVAGSMMALLAASIVLFGIIFYAAVPGKRTPALEPFPRPRLEADPVTELNVLLDRQRQELTGYRWANAEHTKVAIPIERAMAIVAARGDKAFAPIESAGPAGGRP